MRNFIPYLLATLMASSSLALSATTVSAQTASRTISANCVIYAISEKFDFQQDPLWLNLALNPNESRFVMRPIATAVLKHFANEMNSRGKQVHLVAFPDTAQFKPLREGKADLFLERFENLYSDFNAQMHELGFNPVDMMDLAKANRLSGDYHRDLDHHLTSRGRFLLASDIARSINSREAEPDTVREDIDTLDASYAKFPKETFKVWKPSALNFTIDECKEEVDQMLTDELVELPQAQPVVELDDDSLFGDAPVTERVVLAGTSQSLSAKSNLADMITHFSGLEVDNFSEAGGGASMALQTAAAEGVLSDPGHTHLVWEVFSDYDEKQLVGAVLSGRGMEPEACANGRKPEPIGEVIGKFSQWAMLADLPQKQGIVLSLPNDAHTKGIASIRFDFPDGEQLEAEIWRWSPEKDPAALGAWKVFVPDFTSLGMEAPEAISFSFRGLYEYQPTGKLSLVPSWCPAKTASN